MLAFRENLGYHKATVRADLRGSVWVNPDQQRTSFLGFVRQHVQELCPSGIRHAFAHVAATEPIDVQVLDSDEPELAHQAGRELVLEITSFVCDSLVKPPDLPAPLPVAFTASKSATLRSSR